MLKMIVAVILSFLCLGCSGTSVYTETGENICLKFPIIKTNNIQYISRDTLIICYHISDSVFKNPGGWINRTFDCDATSEWISICFNHTREEDAGHFSHRIGISDYKENVTLTIAAPPNVVSLRDASPLEDTNLNVECLYFAGKPPETTVYWTRMSDLSFRQEGKILKLTDIKRNMSDSYSCTAENTYTSGKKGRAVKSMDVNVLYPPYVLPMENLSPVEGSTVDVTCDYTHGNPSKTNVFWTRSNDSLLENGTTLILTDIRRENADNYTCTAENSYPSGANGQHSQTVNIQVLYPPVVGTMQDMFPVEGMDFAVECKFIHGNPIQTLVYWTRVQSDIFKQNGTTLALPGIHREASDTYTCTVENIYPSGNKGKHSQSLKIKVQYVPEIYISPAEMITAMVGQTVISRCDAMDPDLVLLFKWRKQGNLSLLSMKSILVFERVDVSDEGNYTCTVSNKAGNKSISASLVVQFTPLQPTQFMAFCGDIYADIVWTFTSVASINQSSLLQYTPKSSLINSSQGFQDTTKGGLCSSRVVNLEPSTTYEFRILTTNKHGTTYSRKHYCLTKSAFSKKTEAVLGGTLGTFLAIAILIVLTLIAILIRRKLTGVQREGTSRWYRSK